MELSLDGNPLSMADTAAYRRHLIDSIRTLRHLDLKVRTDAARTEDRAALTNRTKRRRVNQLTHPPMDDLDPDAAAPPRPRARHRPGAARGGHGAPARGGAPPRDGEVRAGPSERRGVEDGE